MYLKHLNLPFLILAKFCRFHLSRTMKIVGFIRKRHNLERGKTHIIFSMRHGGKQSKLFKYIQTYSQKEQNTNKISYLNVISIQFQSMPKLYLFYKTFYFFILRKGSKFRSDDLFLGSTRSRRYYKSIKKRISFYLAKVFLWVFLFLIPSSKPG